MGFWHTGYFEHHEWSGWEMPFDPTPEVFRCETCGQQFGTRLEAREHRFEAHPFHRPAMFVRGSELGETRLFVRRRLIPEEVDFLNARTATLNDATLTPDELRLKICQITDGVAVIALANAGVSARYSLVFEVPDPLELDGVDEAIGRLVQRGRLDHRTLEQFIAETRSFNSARAYWDGVCQYFYGVMAKERSLESSLPYERYAEKFNQASESLREIDRGPARLIRALIAYHFNHFEIARDAGGGSRVGKVAARYAGWLRAHRDVLAGLADKVCGDRLDAFFADRETEEMLRLGSMPLTEILSMGRNATRIRESDVPEIDKAKVHVLFAQAGLYAGDSDAVRRHARELLNKPGFEAWANRLLSAKDGGKA